MLVVASGLYVLAVALAPAIPFIDGKSPQATAEKLVTSKPGSDGNRLFIPQLNVDVPVGSDEIAPTHATHRQPAQGDPLKGGNFVINANRFAAGVTPMQTKSMSPFYNLDKLQVGDELFVDWGEKRYVYQVSKKTAVPTPLTQVEAPTKESRLTLHACAEQCETVVEAKPMGVVAWNGSKSYIQPN